MNRSIVRASAMLTLISIGFVQATTQFRSPVIFENRGMIHYPLDNIQNSCWQNMLGICGMLPEDEDYPWYIYQWAGAYYRCANRAFNDPCCPNKVTTKRSSLNTIFFGAESFKAEQSFVNGIITNLFLPNFTPFLSFSAITPHIDYTEKGAYFGLSVERRFGCEDEWRFGCRMTLPFKVINVSQSDFCAIEEGLGDVIAEKPFNIEGNSTINAYDFAYRLDFLSSLVRPALPVSNSRPLVQYGDGTVANRTQLAGVNIDNPNPINDDIYFIKESNTLVPLQTTLPNSTKQSWAKSWFQVNGQLPASGSGIDNSVYNFTDVNNYAANLALNRAAQSTLWAVPRVIYAPDDSTGTIANMDPQSIAIRNAIRAVIDSLEFSEGSSALAFLSARCIDLCRNSRNVGIGDLTAEFYGGYGDSDYDCWFAHMVAGVRFPTGKRMDRATNVYFQTTGHNGHYEAEVGAELGWRPHDCFAIRADAYYNHVFRRTEKKAAPFAGATIINIGPSIDAKVSWSYVTAHLDCTIFHPCNTDLGMVIGTEVFAKQKDKVRLCSTTAVDLLGQVQPLNPALLECGTNAMTIKIRGEIFHRWNFGELFVSGSQVLAGRHSMQESELALGVAVYF